MYDALLRRAGCRAPVRRRVPRGRLHLVARRAAACAEVPGDDRAGRSYDGGGGHDEQGRRGVGAGPSARLRSSSRMTGLAAAAALVLVLAGSARAGQAAPSWEVSLTRPGDGGPALVVEGTLIALPDSMPIRNAAVRAYHADASGHYMRAGERGPHFDGTVHTN